MPELHDTHRSPADAVRAAVDAAEARRRGRESSARLWRVAPAAAGVCVLVAAVNWWARGPVALPIGIVAVAVLGLAAYVRVLTRRHPVTDDIASRIDADGQFGGELRSASWFAAREAPDEWAQFHLERAASRFAGVDWPALYPSIASGRPRAVTAGLLAAAVAIGALTPGRARVEARGPLNIPVTGSTLARGKGMRLEMLPEDLRQQIEDLLASAEQGTGTAQKQTEAAEMIWNMFTALNSDINADKLKELAKRMDPTNQGSASQAAKKLEELAGRSVKAADTRELPQDLRQALTDLGSALATAADAEQQAADTNAANSPAPSSNGSANANATSADGPQSLENAAIQMSRDGNAAAGAGMMMMSSQMNAMGNPSAGFGGAGNSNTQANTGVPPLDLNEALRRETIEASADTTGDNVLSETRRKTEHGQATVGFTHSASGTSDRSRATAPPPVPEDLRGTVQSYFNRKQ
jgi:hypothetical protein